MMIHCARYIRGLINNLGQIVSNRQVMIYQSSLSGLTTCLSKDKGDFIKRIIFKTWIIRTWSTGHMLSE